MLAAVSLLLLVALIGRYSRRATMERRLTLAAERLAKAGFAPTNIHHVCVEAVDVRQCVLEACEQHSVDAVVVGTRGHGVLKRALLGSLSSYLAHHATVPVIITRSKFTT